ncbi:putative two-component system hydrogenase maturation factor HypX/HoxX [Streptomyces sp. 2333.5]|uniref:hydrogenase maturation protein n=1 Tax=unclassified Streptomyces TaxID=2593676 RepID=UPI0008984939|nr:MULTISPECIES: hydrogenase maturation protein [unclassified Streptomyces]PJJ00364.1 putative two-component system hydrogenase maturation factor HypX/HoxX [Streptomyces sp. 2333.5]SEC77667.1 putative two-component system protein, hydrogenase maturation factor HypX/HoxX [Streptomyces sp. 2112.2]
MRILLIAGAFNSLTQRVYAELGDRGHQVSVELVTRETPLAEVVHRRAPDLIVAPMLKTAVPREVWSARPCLIVHPGPVGDRGPSSVDWAVQLGADRWGVTVLQANDEMDAGDIWAAAECPVPAVGKSDLYRNEIADAAVEAVLTAVARVASGTHRPQPQAALPAAAKTGHPRPPLRQEARRIDWRRDPTDTVVRTLRAADSQPGVRDELLGDIWYLHGGHPEDTLTGRPGELLATRCGAICRATADGAVWIPELRPPRTPGEPGTVKLPATLALGDRLPPLPEVPAPLGPGDGPRTWADIRYREDGPAGFLEFSFPGGAMSTDHCRRLLTAYRHACSRPTSVLVLGGRRDFFSNGIHLNVIEAADDPAGESWANLNAMDDLVQAVLTTTDRLVVAALGGNAAAGGAMLALAADEVWCRSSVVLNPHYRLMGLYGSEYWTYTLPRRTGPEVAEQLTTRALPLTAATGARLGLVDRILDCAAQDFAAQTARLAVRLASAASTQARIAAKKADRERDEADRPLAAYREDELARMHRIFFDPEQPYHALRRAFVRKEPSGTPAHLNSAAPAGT